MVQEVSSHPSACKEARVTACTCIDACKPSWYNPKTLKAMSGRKFTSMAGGGGSAAGAEDLYGTDTDIVKLTDAVFHDEVSKSDDLWCEMLLHLTSGSWRSSYILVLCPRTQSNNNLVQLVQVRRILCSVVRVSAYLAFSPLWKRRLQGHHLRHLKLQKVGATDANQSLQAAGA